MRSIMRVDILSLSVCVLTCIVVCSRAELASHSPAISSDDQQEMNKHDGDDEEQNRKNRGTC
jgi:hypothetical protein